MPLLYYITDRTAFPGNEFARRHRLLEKIAEAARAGVDYIQLREKDLSARDLEGLANEAVKVLSETRNPATGHRHLPTALLINSRTDVALAVGAAGVHLRSNDISPADVRAAWSRVTGDPAREILQKPVTISISCHSSEEVSQASDQGADLALLAPVFQKKDILSVEPTGLSQLHAACRNQIPVFALGGITLENARSCIAAGAVGVAAIRLFQENNIAEIAMKLGR